MKKRKKYKVDEEPLRAGEPQAVFGHAGPELSESQIKRIEESKEQFKKGQFLTNEEADALADEWLKE